MDRVLDMSILFGLRERPRQVQTYVYTAKTALLHFLCATGSHKVSVLLLRKGWAFFKKVQSAVRKDIGENRKGRVHTKNPSTCKAIYIVKNKQKSQDNPLPLEEWLWFLQILLFGRNLILAKCTQHKPKTQEVLLSLWDWVDSAAVED